MARENQLQVIGSGSALVVHEIKRLGMPLWAVILVTGDEAVILRTSLSKEIALTFLDQEMKKASTKTFELEG